jgi:hypothetical protein
LAGRALILSSKASAYRQEIPMTGHLKNRLANFCTSLLLALLILSVVSAARAVSDDGIVRVKSAVPMAEAISRIKADIAAKGQIRENIYAYPTFSSDIKHMLGHG